MRILHEKLHLQHHKHTGKVLHHRHTSYRGLAVVLVLAGVSIISLNSLAKTTADSLNVYARIPAPIPTTAAVILSPTNGTTTAKSDLTVSGTCPVITPQVVIGIIDNGTLAGSMPCDSSNTFSLPITLTPGQHTLIARSYTITDDTGPDSDPVVITYTPPVVPSEPAATPPSGHTTTPSTAEGSTAPLVVTIDEPFIVFGPLKYATWLGSITGGTTPYQVHIDWGDDSSSDYTITADGQQHFTHRYHAMQPHIIALRVTDHSGQTVSHDYAAVTPYIPPVSSPISAVTPHAGGPFGGTGIFGLYGMYLMLLAVFGTLWVRSHGYAYAKIPVQHRAKHLTQKNKLRHR